MNTLRTLLATAFLLAGTASMPAHAADATRKGASITLEDKDGDGPERIEGRQKALAGTPYLLSTNRWSEMMLRDNAVTMQLTDYGLKQVGEQDTGGKDEGLLGNMIKALALSGVRQLLNHSIALSLADTRSALVRDGEVILVTCKGKEVFNKVKINDQVQKYPRQDAEAFVRHLNRIRATLPACRT